MNLDLNLPFRKSYPNTPQEKKTKKGRLKQPKKEITVYMKRVELSKMNELIKQVHLMKAKNS